MWKSFPYTIQHFVGLPIFLIRKFYKNNEAENGQKIRTK